MSRRKSSKRKQETPALPVRNPVAANPLLGKSTAHGKTRKATRRTDKVALRKMTFERVACRDGQAIGSNAIHAIDMTARAA